MKYITVFCICLFMQSCFWGVFTGVTVKVENGTDSRVMVSKKDDYSSEWDAIDNGWFRINSGDSTILSYSAWTLDPEVIVEYKGIEHIYEGKVNFWGYCKVVARKDDFYNNN